jgi:hypothetical protein
MQGDLHVVESGNTPIEDRPCTLPASRAQVVRESNNRMALSVYQGQRDSHDSYELHSDRRDKDCEELGPRGQRSRIDGEHPTQ